MKFLIYIVLTVFLVSCVSSPVNQSGVIKFKAFGSNPFWSAEINKDMMNVKLSENDKIGTDHKMRVQRTGSIMVYRSDANKILIQYKKCTDSDKEYKRLAIMFVGEKKYEGCAKIIE